MNRRFEAHKWPHRWGTTTVAGSVIESTPVAELKTCCRRIRDLTRGSRRLISLAAKPDRSSVAVPARCCRLPDC